ncbi:MAG: 4-hydroxy-3-methylbut-2-enyl diphosphate reductase [Desulfovibrionales bacterium]
MEVIRAETAGFCMGVILALDKLDSLIQRDVSGKSIYTLGPIIHNPQVLEEYAKKGVILAHQPDDVSAGRTAVIRAHGIPKHVKSSLLERGVKVVDATCPKVKRAQLLIEKQAKQGRRLLLYGEESHPEVKGLLSYAQAGAFLFDSIERMNELPLEKEDHYCLAAQTTQDRVVFEEMAGSLSSRLGDGLMILNTICDATQRRQEEAVHIARNVEYMVVVGGFNSGNTRRLVQVVAGENTPVTHVEGAADLPMQNFTSVSRVGLTAGASTPKRVIDEIHSILSGM